MWMKCNNNKQLKKHVPILPSRLFQIKNEFIFIIQEHEYAPNAYEYEMIPYEYETGLISTFNLYYIYR
jgi:hypothetical protein